MSKKDYMEVEVMVGYDSSHEEQTDRGVFMGKELKETVRIPIEDAKDIVQSTVYRLDYGAAREFADKYKK